MQPLPQAPPCSPNPPCLAPPHSVHPSILCDPAGNPRTTHESKHPLAHQILRASHPLTQSILPSSAILQVTRGRPMSPRPCTAHHAHIARDQAGRRSVMPILLTAQPIRSIPIQHPGHCPDISSSQYGRSDVNGLSVAAEPTCSALLRQSIPSDERYHQVRAPGHAVPP
ncbi:hypothetical protein PLICRDRAFT_568428 [Plicaturopsis crispa FD-325 SS-3]|nr:hypothetical protein PLICRDRAFT_568428 [Plicaturopsis crispa FD-325 SS-3]